MLITYWSEFPIPLNCGNDNLGTQVRVLYVLRTLYCTVGSKTTSAASVVKKRRSTPSIDRDKWYRTVLFFRAFRIIKPLVHDPFWFTLKHSINVRHAHLDWHLHQWTEKRPNLYCTWVSSGCRRLYPNHQKPYRIGWKMELDLLMFYVPVADNSLPKRLLLFLL